MKFAILTAVLLGKNHIGGVDADTGPLAAAGEDSDYYTPEDPATTILSPLHTDKVCYQSCIYSKTLTKNILLEFCRRLW